MSLYKRSCHIVLFAIMHQVPLVKVFNLKEMNRMRQTMHLKRYSKRAVTK